MTDRYPGCFIVFEGGDGAGKSTQATRLAGWLTDRGYAVTTTFEPGDTAVGAKVRELVLHSDIDITPRAEALLYAVDKAQHVEEVIKPALAAGRVVISDRYTDSTIAYQGAGRAVDLGDVARLAWWAVDGLVPDLTVLMDVAPAVGLSDKASLDRIESAGEDFHHRVRRHFLELAAAEPARYLVVNGRGPKDEVTDQITGAVAGLLTRRGVVPAG